MRTGPGSRNRIGAVSIVATVFLVLTSPPVFSQALPDPAQNATAGARVFGSSGCVECHAVRGLGGQIAPDLAEVEGRRSFFDLAATLWNHIPRMAERMAEENLPRPRLNASKVGDLFAFLYSVDYFDEPGDPDVGRGLFHEKRCVMCHQLGGVGGVIGPSLDHLGQFRSPIPVAAAMWNHGPSMSEEMRRRGIERPSFQGAELLDLLAYLRSAAESTPRGSIHVLPGNADEGLEALRTHRCTECHAVRGRGGNVGPDLAARGGESLLDFAAAMWNKAPAMRRAMGERGVALPDLEASEMADIVAYLYSVRYFADAGDPARGRALISSKGCDRCHGADRDAPALDEVRSGSYTAAFAELWNHLRLEERLVEWPTMTAEEMAGLIAYLSGASR